MTWFLIDTNHLSAAIRPVSPVRNRLLQTRRAGHVLGVCMPILGELEAGIQQTADPDSYRQRLRELSRHLRIWPLEPVLARPFGEIANWVRTQGRVLGQIDLLIAALCRHMNLVLLTSDRDFNALPDLRTENWLSEPTEK
jgi:tRNA(fMet)-specific endonuclease VapC